MKRTVLSVEDALRQGKDMPFAYISRLSSVSIGIAPAELDLTELTEARLFGQSGEIRVWKMAEGYSAMLLTEDEGSVFLDSEAEVISPKFGKRLTKRQYIAFDEDGQGYIAATRLLDWEG